MAIGEIRGSARSPRAYVEVAFLGEEEARAYLSGREPAPGAWKRFKGLMWDAREAIEGGLIDPPAGARLLVLAPWERDPVRGHHRRGIVEAYRRVAPIVSEDDPRFSDLDFILSGWELVHPGEGL